MVGAGGVAAIAVARSSRIWREQMRSRLLIVLVPLALSLALLLAPAADAYNDGRGFYGATNDKVVTNFGFGLIIFFPLFVFTMSMIQRSLEKRKEARKAAQKKLGGAQWRGGW
jgi:hypothetical protein